MYMQRLIEESVINISREYPSVGVHEALVPMRPQSSDTLDKLRAKFFILLNQDMAMRKKLSIDQGKGNIVKHVCEHKAARFYQELNAMLIPSFAQDQTVSLESFVDELRQLYICS